MSRVYDNWERLVDAVLKRQHLREIALCPSLSSSSSSSDVSSRFSFDSSLGDVSGTLEYISDHKHKKKKRLQTVNLKVRMERDGCELKVKNALSSLSGVKSVEINRKQQKVTVIGYVEHSEVLKKAKSIGKKAEIWPYVPYNLVAQPYASQSNYEVPYIFMFSDDNPNACSIM